MKTNMNKFLNAKLFLIEQQAMKHLYCNDIGDMQKAMKEIQELCASSYGRIEEKFKKMIVDTYDEVENNNEKI